MSTTTRWLRNKWRHLRLPTLESLGLLSLSHAPTLWSQSWLSLFHAPTRQSIGSLSDSPYSPIHTLNNDVILHIFYVYLLEMKDEEEDENVRWKRCRQRWWYKPAWVCRRWRQLILASPSRLDLHLLCTYGVPVGDMLAHSPPLPLTIFYDDCSREMTAEDEDSILLALSHCDRVHRVALGIPASKLGKFTTPMNEEFPILERMSIQARSHDSSHLASLKAFRAPSLRHMWTSCIPIQSPLPPNTTSLVNLELIDIPASVYFPPSYLLTQLSHTPQLETLVIHFHAPLPNRDVTRQLSNTPFTTNVTLPHLRLFSFRGVSAYLEGLLSRISAPSLNSLDVQFFNQLTFSVPCLLHFMQTSGGLGFSSIELTFYDDLVVLVSDPHRSWQQRPLRLQILCRHLDWQVATAAQILGKLSPVLSAMEELTLRLEKPDRSSELHNQVDETQWRELFMPLSRVKKLCVPDTLFGEGSHSQSLRLEDKELFPDLLEVQYSGSWQCCGTEFEFKQEWDLHRLQERERERLREQVELERERDRDRQRQRQRDRQRDRDRDRERQRMRARARAREQMQEREREREWLRERELERERGRGRERERLRERLREWL
jgi:hypothetical protein